MTTIIKALDEVLNTGASEIIANMSLTLDLGIKLKGDYYISFSPCGKYLATCLNTDKIFIYCSNPTDIRYGDSIMILDGVKNMKDVMYSPCGKYIVTSYCDYSDLTQSSWICIWDVTIKDYIKTFKCHDNTNVVISYSSCGNYIFTSSYDKIVKIWNVNPKDEKFGTCNISFKVDVPVSCFSHSPCGKYITFGFNNGSIITRHIKDSSNIMVKLTDPKVIYQNHRISCVNSCEWSPCGKYIAIATDNKIVGIFSYTSQKCILSLKGHEDGITLCLWLHNGKQLITRSYDGTIRLWCFDDSIIDKYGKCISYLIDTKIIEEEDNNDRCIYTFALSSCSKFIAVSTYIGESNCYINIIEVKRMIKY